jgi:translation initiation factor IF-3
VLCANPWAFSAWNLRALVAHVSTPRGGPISTETRINDRIRVPEVRLVGAGGEQVGIVRVEEALRLAVEADLDLVEVAPEARPPVCKIMDYGKFRYETAQKARESRKHQQNTVIKEQKLRPKIDDHDYETKKGHVVRFLDAGAKVKVTIMFRGREQSRPELGHRLLQRLGADVSEHGFVETVPRLDGRNMTMILAPHRGAKTRAKAAQQAAEASSGATSSAAHAEPAPAEPAQDNAPQNGAEASAPQDNPAAE